MTTNRPKNSAEVPTSLSKISTTRLTPQAMSTGPRSRARGRSMPRNGARPGPEHIALGHQIAREDTASASLANSSGWTVKPPTEIWILARVPGTSLMLAGSTAGNATSTRPIAPSV